MPPVRTKASGGTVPALVNQPVPTLSGTQTVGQVLTCNVGTWYGQNPLTFAFQWIRGASTNVGTNSNQYTIVAGDQTNTIKCQVTVSNALGSTTLTTAPTGTIP